MANHARERVAKVSGFRSVVSRIDTNPPLAAPLDFVERRQKLPRRARLMVKKVFAAMATTTTDLPGRLTRAFGKSALDS